MTAAFAIMQMADEPSEGVPALEPRLRAVRRSRDDLGVPLQANTLFQDKERYTLVISWVLFILSPS